MILSIATSLLLSVSSSVSQAQSIEMVNQTDYSRIINICDIDPTAGGCQGKLRLNICDIDPTAGGCQTPI